MKYWAFISYSHSDSNWGKWLHRKLESFPVPRALVGRETERGYKVPKRLLPIFRDREELPGAAALKDNIQVALEQSRFLIVICSPRSAASVWVNEEVLAFKAMGRADRVLCLIVDGEPNATDKPGCGLLECFPPAVRHAVNPDRSLSALRDEPIAADARPAKDGKVDALLKLAAGLLGVGFDELKRRDARRRRRKKVAFAFVGIAFAALLAWGGWEFRAQRVGLQNAAASMVDFREAAAAFDSGDSGLGMAYLARALKKDPRNQAAAQRLFFELTYKNWVQSVKQVASGEGWISSADFNPDRSRVALTKGKSRDLLVLDTSSGDTLLSVKATEDWRPMFVTFCGDNMLAVRGSAPSSAGLPNCVRLYEIPGGKVLKEFRLEGHVSDCVASTRDGKRIFVGWAKTSPNVYYDPYRLGFYAAETDQATGAPTGYESRSGAIQTWTLGDERPLLKTLQWPVVSLCVGESTECLFVGCQTQNGGFNAGQIEFLSLAKLEPVRDAIVVRAPVIQLQTPASGRLAASCLDGIVRLYGGSNPTLEATFAQPGRQKVLFMQKLIAFATSTGETGVMDTDGLSAIPTWTQGANFAGLDSNAPLNSVLVSWAGATPIDRGGKVVLKQMWNPSNPLVAAPMEPPLWWPSQSIFSAAVSARAEKLFILRHGASFKSGAALAPGYRWDLISVPLANRAARMENAPYREIRPCSIRKSPSGRSFVFLLPREQEEARTHEVEMIDAIRTMFQSGAPERSGPVDVVICDADNRKEKCRARAPEGVLAAAFSPDEKIVVALSASGVTLYDQNLHEVASLPSECPLVRDTNGVPLMSMPNAGNSPLVGFAETDQEGAKNFLVLLDTAQKKRVARIALPGRPTDISITGDGALFVASWGEGDARKCAVFRATDGALVKNLPDLQTPRGFSRDGRRLLMGAYPNDFLYETSNWTEVAELAGHARMICCSAFDPLDRFLATGALDGSVRMWDLENGKQIGEEMPPLRQRLQQSSKIVTGVEIDESGSRLLVRFLRNKEQTEIPSENLEGSLAVWDVKEQLATVPEYPVPFLNDAWFIGGSPSIAVVTGDGAGRFVSYLDASIPSQEVTSDIWKVAQEVSGYSIADQIVKSEKLVDARDGAPAQSAASSAAPSAAEAWLKWYFADPMRRTISPLSKVQAAEYRRTLVDKLRRQRHLIEAFEMDRADDINLANLALATDNASAADATWDVVGMSGAGNKDIVFRKAVQLFERSYYDEDVDSARYAAIQLKDLVRSSLEQDLMWRPFEQGLSRNAWVGVDRAGFLKLVSHSGSPEAAKKAAVLSAGQVKDALDPAGRQKYFEKSYDPYIQTVAHARESVPGVTLSCAGSDLRRCFWMDQAEHPLGRALLDRWTLLQPGAVADGLANDMVLWRAFYPGFALPLWLFARDSFHRVLPDVPPERVAEFKRAQGRVAALAAMSLLESGENLEQAESFARESLQARQEGGEGGWMVSNSKALVGATMLKRGRFEEAKPFVLDGAKELLAAKDTLPAPARPRVIEALGRAVQLCEAAKDDAGASYWRAQLTQLKADTAYSALE